MVVGGDGGNGLKSVMVLVLRAMVGGGVVVVLCVAVVVLQSVFVVYV